jgi:hypothetical protein
MNISSFTRRIILTIGILILIVMAGMLFVGALSQTSRSRTVGQIVETSIQITCGVLTLLSVYTCFYRKRLRNPIRTIWVITLMITAGMSSLVWGPPMLTVGLVFTAGALLIALAIIWLLQSGGA